MPCGYERMVRRKADYRQGVNRCLKQGGNAYAGAWAGLLPERTRKAHTGYKRNPMGERPMKNRVIES